MKNIPSIAQITPLRSKASLLAVLGLFLVALTPATVLHAQTAPVNTWDPLATGNGSDGDGTWDSTSLLWTSGSGTDTKYNTGSQVYFGAGGTGDYTVTVSGITSASNITFNSGNYTLEAAVPSSPISIGFSGGGITFAATGAEATFENIYFHKSSGQETVAGNGTLNFSGASSGFINTGSGAVVIGNNAGDDVSVTLGTGATITTATSTIKLGAGTNSTATLTVNSGGSVSMAGVSGTPGIFYFGPQSSSVGSTAILNINSGGIVTVGQLSQTATTTGTINFNGGVLQAATNNAGASFVTQSTAGLTANVQAGGATIDPNGTAITFAAAINNGTGGTTDGGLTVGTATDAAPGTLTLSAANTFTGVTTVLANNTLNLGAVAALQNSTYNVSSAGNLTFGVSGSQIYYFGGLQGAGVINAGATNYITLNDGNFTGQSAVTIANGGVYQNAGTAAIQVTSARLALGGVLTVDFSSTLAPGTYTFYLLTNSGSMTGAFDSLSIVGSYLADNASGVTATDGNGDTFTLDGGTLTADIVAIPEPATCAALLGAAVLGFAFYRRRTA